MKTQYILFDLDNTLYNAETIFAEIRTLIKVWLSEALSITPDEAYTLSLHYYHTYGSTLNGIRREHPNLDSDAYLAHIHKVPVETYLQPNPVLAAMLARLPLPKVIFTNSVCEWSERVLGRLEVREHFERIIDIRAVHYQGKPNPLAFQHVLDILEVPGNACIFVDDHPLNIQAGLDAGMQAILVSDNGASVDAGAAPVVKDVLAAEPILLKMLDVA